MPFTEIKSGIPLRAPAALVQAPAAATIEEVRAAPYMQVAPGLYPGELVVELDTGEWVAVSVARMREATGSGMDFRAWARLIEPDGRTKLDPAKQEMELEFPFSADAGMLEAFTTGEARGEDRIGRELIMLVLGEPLTMVDVKVDEGEPPVQAPLCGWSEGVRLNASIRSAIAFSAATTDQVDVAALLKL